MGDPFAAADRALIQSALAERVTYTPNGGSPVSIRVIFQNPDDVGGLDGLQIVVGGHMLMALASDVPAPAAGDTVSHNGTEYTVVGEPRRDGALVQFGVR